MSDSAFHDQEESAKDLANDWNPVFDNFSSGDLDLSLGAVKPVPSPRISPITSGVDHLQPFGSHPHSLPGEANEPVHLFNFDGANSDRAERIDSLISARRPATVEYSPQAASTFAKPTSPPKVGDTICGFSLISILGKGAFATVYLAEQIDLGHRLVALKVSRAEGEEPQILAKLQHTHIVPIYSVNDDPATGLRLLCMPYLGGANLAQVLEAAEHRMTNAKGSHKSLVAALDEVSRRFYSAQGSIRSVLENHESRSRSRTRLAGGNSVRISRELDEARLQTEVERGESAVRGSLSIWKLPTFITRLSLRGRSSDFSLESNQEDFDQPARLFLREADTIQAAVWVIARLAEGLEHAHSRGMLHRDLKPSNILIARDGTPMLLDFNLSTEVRPKNAEEGEKAMLGGTLPYMSPEHLEAFNPKGTATADSVTERSDIYALGLIFYEMLAGEHPFPEPPGRRTLTETLRLFWVQRQTVPSIREVRPDVPWSIDTVVRKCLDPDPRKRYATARELSEDLSCHLNDQSLKHTPEPSLKERLGKWKRRNPRLCGNASIAIFSIFAIVFLGFAMAGLASNLQTLAARVKFHTFENNFMECRFLLNVQNGPTEHLGRGLQLATKTLESEEMAADGVFLTHSWVNRLTISEQKQVREQTSELLLLQSRSKIELAERNGNDSRRLQAIEQAIRSLENAERLDPKPPAVLYSDLARYHAAIGRGDLAAIDRDRERSHQPSTLRDFQLLGSTLLTRNQISQALVALQRAIDLDPKAYWAWFALGHCHFEQGRYVEAAGDFSVCVALEPRFAWSYLNRGLALARVGRLDEARDSYRRAIDKNPRFAEAWVNLAAAELELNDLKEAERAIEMAKSLGKSGTSVLAMLGEIKGRLGKVSEAESLFGEILQRKPDDLNVLNARGIFRIKTNPTSAIDDFKKVINIDPTNARAHFGLALLHRKSDPQTALDSVEIALKTDPNFLDALQLRAITKARLGIASAADDAEKLARIETANRLYNAACAMALLSEKVADEALGARALDYLERSVELGFAVKAAAVDPDLKAISSTNRFMSILQWRDRPAKSG